MISKWKFWSRGTNSITFAVCRERDAQVLLTPDKEKSGDSWKKKTGNCTKSSELLFFPTNIIKRTIAGFHMASLKFKREKLSILPRFDFHDVLEQLKTNFHKNFLFKRVLGFEIEYA